MKTTLEISEIMHPVSKYPHQYQEIRFPSDFPVNFFRWAVPARTADSLHVHNCTEIGLCISGTGVFLIESKVIPFSAGDVFLIGEKEFHKAFSTNGAESVWEFLQFPSEFLLQAEIKSANSFFDSARLAGPGFMNRITSPETTFWMQIAAKEIRERKTGNMEIVRSLLRCLMIAAVRTAGESANAPDGEDRGDAGRIAPALDCISRHYADKNVLQKLPALCGMSRSTFFREFRRALRSTPGEYLDHFRIRMGAYLLRNRKFSVRESAAAAGYGETSTFFRQFRKVYGISPSAYRRENGEIRP